MTGIHHFIEDVEKNKGISASKLDNNFRRVGPITGLDGNAHGYRIEETEDGWRLVLEEAEGASGVDHPWRISRVGAAFKVELASAVYSGVAGFSGLTITGLDTVTTATAGYVVCELNITQGNTSTPPSATGGSIVWNLSALPSRITSTKTIIPLGYIYAAANGALAVRQLAFQNFSLVNMCVNGASSLVPFPT